MRADQLQRLQELSEKLADVFIVEADPANWSGGGLPRDMSQEERGNRHWDRKGALGTGAVLAHTLNVIKHYEGRKPAPGDPEDTDDPMISVIDTAEQKAKQALDRVMNKAKGKDEFDRRIHGKA